MQFFTTVLALSGAALVAAQGETRLLTPTGAAPAGCTGTVDGKFKITLYDVSGAAAPAKRDLEKRQAGPVECSGAEGSLEVQVEGGVLTDSKGRIGSIISANRQFQFDGPPAQAGALYTGGWSICNNGSLAIGPSANFYRCRSGNFANLYDQPSESECELVAIGVLPCSGSTLPAGSSAPVSSAAAETTPAASESTYAASSAAASTPAGSAPAGSAPAPSAPAVTQIGDGQIQYPTGAVPTMISEISDGQVQAPTVPAVPAPSAPSAVVSQISDGQVQFPTGTAAPAPSAPAANGTISAPSPPIATGAASLNTIASGLVAVVAGVVAVAML